MALGSSLPSVSREPQPVRPRRRGATNSEGAVCNHDQTELLETQRVRGVSARFEAWIAPTRTWRAVAVFVCFSARLLHFVRRVSCHRFDMLGCAPSKPACSCRSQCVSRLFADGSTSRESGRELGGSRLHTTCVDLNPAPSSSAANPLPATAEHQEVNISPCHALKFK